MRIRLKFKAKHAVQLKASYNSLIQAIIYNLLEDLSANFLHQKGFEFKNRKFKLFCFSEILERGQYLEKEKLLKFSHYISFILSSPVDWILEQVATNSITNNSFFLWHNDLTLEEVTLLQQDKRLFNSGHIIVKAITPIEVHSTFVTQNGSKKTYYYNPREKEFSQLVNDNAQRKFSAFYKTTCNYKLSINPVSKHVKEVIRFFNGIVVKGYQGIFELEAHPKMLEFIIDTGLGSRNSQGFGMVEVVNDRSTL